MSMMRSTPVVPRASIGIMRPNRRRQTRAKQPLPLPEDIGRCFAYQSHRHLACRVKILLLLYYNCSTYYISYQKSEIRIRKRSTVVAIRTYRQTEPTTVFATFSFFCLRTNIYVVLGTRVELISATVSTRD